MDIIISEKIPIVFTSAGNPKQWTSHLKKEGIKVVHVVSSTKFAIKSQDAGVDAVVAEGFEAGGHNGREETTTLCLIPDVRANIHIPLIAAGGIATGKAMYAAMSLGAEGVQIGSRFVCTPEASSHPAFKQEVVAAKEGDTKLVLKNLTPVRLLKNKFYQDILIAEASCQTRDELLILLGIGRAKMGMMEGDLKEGELEIGQVSALINDIVPASDVVKNLWEEFCAAYEKPFEGFSPQ